MPRIVDNIMNAYGDAFGYLKGKTITIGLEYFYDDLHDGGAMVAYVQSGYCVGTNSNYITFTLGVNIHSSVIPDNAQHIAGVKDALSELESTIAHEMIHGFMFQTMGAGMHGNKWDGSNKVNVGKFPDWFSEGMAQTASGAGNWLTNTNALGIKNPTTGAKIKNIADINAADKLGTGSIASQYGTGYLACMYLGAVISGYSADKKENLDDYVRSGLNTLLASVINGNSLDASINTLTKGAFTGIADFETKFNAGTGSTSLKPDDFIADLFAVTGTGLGGLASDSADGNPLDDKDLANQAKPLKNINSLFQLDPGYTSNNPLQNKQGNSSDVLAGGGAFDSGTAPSGFSWDGKVFPIFGNNKGGKGGIALQIGDTAGQLLEVPTFYLSTEALNIKDISINKLETADDAIDKIQAAINTVSDMRGQYGALGNRLEHTINNLSNMKENITDAESTIRDVDVAEEMMKYTKNNILMQSAQAMLAQANGVYQGVLQLIQ